ncbi:hypothetical protein N7510_001079 [Penicillium lagena]|uniref:uncharacterized protein n=1 Tax=Penicillium lagena TaxID=94218 RepID=UPI002542652D|nr:uncharacterized protein N7510_001079 [Penicillium lagena]KAJ5624770.1 hypothetical protein N7510_001079 [Penicillium lagena]
MVVKAQDGTSLKERLSWFTPVTAFLTFYLSLAALNFGYDVGTFSGVQAMDPFIRRFGSYDKATQDYVIPGYLASVMNSTPFIGKLIGALACGIITERWGRRSAVAVMACVSLVGVTLQTSATTAAQFTLGRIINFGMTGFCIVVTPIYQAECSPPVLRGLISSTVQFQIILGQLIASLVNLGTEKITSNSSWQIPIGLQFIVPVCILALLPFMPESPRWLVSKGRYDEAERFLKTLRPKSATSEEISLEIEYLQHSSANQGKGSWKEVFDKKNRIRTAIAVLVMFCQQITGQAFISQYGVVFYKQQNISDPFLLSVIQTVISVVCSVITLLFVDQVGRRMIILTGGTAMGFFLLLVGGMGTLKNPGPNAKRTMVASLMMYGASYALSWATVSYIILGEVANSRVKEKTSDLAVSISVLTTFVVSFTLPYLLDAPYADLGPKVGFIYGSITIVSSVVAYFMVPEMKGRSLEEVDRLFEARVPLRKFQQAKLEEDLEPEKSGA